MKKFVLSAFCLIFISIVPATTFAQAEDTANDQTVNATSQEQAILESLAKAEAMYADISTLDASLGNLNGEELEAAVIQLREKLSALVKELKRFSELAAGYINSGGDINILLADNRDDLLRAGGLLRQNVDNAVQRMERNNQNRDTMTAEGLKAYESDTQLIDLSYSLLSEYVDIVITTGFEPELSANYLIENLPQRAEFLAGRIALSQDRQAELEKAKVNNPDDADIQQRLSLVDEKLNIDAESLKLTIDLAKKVDLDFSQYQTLLIKVTGQISSEVLNTEVIGSLFNDWWLNFKLSVKENSVGYLFKFIVFILILLAFKIVAGFVKKVIRRSFQSQRVNVSQLLQNMLISISVKIIMVLGVLVALSQVGVTLGPVLAGLGVAGFIVGFALQDTLGNFAAGMMILFYRPYDVGDAVEVAGVLGKVQDMSIVSTTILTFDNQTLIIPNSKIWGDVIKNITAQKMRRVDMVFGIGYGDDIAKAEGILRDIIDSHDKVLTEPAPVIKLHNLGDSSVDFVVRPWVKTEDYWDVYWDVTREVKMRFDAEGVSIPFPQRDVHLYQAT